MSTNSVIAIPQGDGWKGRYVHWNGYPTWQAKELLQLVDRDGVEKAIKTLVTGRNFAWSAIYSDTSTMPPNQLGKRGKVVKNYGLAYTTAEGQTSRDEWITSENLDDWISIEWVYVLRPYSLAVFHGSELVAYLLYDKPIDTDLLQQIEEGQ